MDKRIKHKLALAEEQVVAAYENGMSLKEIAELHSCAVNTVRSTLIRRKVQIRRRGPKNGTNRQTS